jgi:hypothetical protein
VRTIVLKRTTALLITAAATVTLTLPAISTAEATTKPVHYKSCAALHKRFPHGVGLKTAKDHVAKGHKPVKNFTKNNAWYQKNKNLDRDHDGIACEAK